MSFRIVKHITTLGPGRGGYVKEINMVSWDSKEPQVDVRYWSPDHEKPGGGITLSESDIMAIKNLL